MKTPTELHLPWSDWRPGQRLAIRTAQFAKKPHVIVQAPTGSGKSAIAGALCQHDNKRTIVLTATNALMQQYERLLPWLAPIRGAGNYECLAATGELSKYFRFIRKRGDITCDDGPCRSNVKCSLKEAGCLYFDAYRHAREHRTVVTNYAYHLAIHQYGKGLQSVDRLICDEAHQLPDELMKAYQQRVPKYLLKGDKTPRTIKQWRSWASKQLEALPAEGQEKDDDRVKVRRLRDTYKTLSVMDDSWAWDTDYDAVVFEPTIPRDLFPLLAAPKTQMIYLSATITPALLTMLDIKPSDVEYHQMPSRFDPARRPIYIVKSVRVDYRMNDIERDWWIGVIDSIISTRQNRKGIIHTVSYDRAQTIFDGSKYSHLMLCPRGKELASAVEYFKSDKCKHKLLVSPALTTGWDFNSRECRYQIIAKLPFPNTSSSIMKARIKHTPMYRNNYTMQQLVQMCGRHVRSDEDWGETFITDDHANWFLRGAYLDLAPDYFLDALQWVDRAPAPLAGSLL